MVSSALHLLTVVVRTIYGALEGVEDSGILVPTTKLRTKGIVGGTRYLWFLAWGGIGVMER